MSGRRLTIEPLPKRKIRDKPEKQKRDDQLNDLEVWMLPVHV